MYKNNFHVDKTIVETQYFASFNVSSKETQNLVPNKETQNLVPNKETQNLASNKETQNLASNKETQNLVPNKETQNLVPNKETQNLVPNKETQNLVPNKETQNLASLPMKKKCCLIIDPATCKDYMVPRFHKRDIEVIAVFTDSLLSFFKEFSALTAEQIHELVKIELEGMSFDKIYYLWEFDNLECFKSLFSEYNVLNIINANEYSIETTAKLCKLFEFEFNPDHVIKTLLSKYDVNEVCSEKGVKVCREIENVGSELSSEKKSTLEEWGYPLFVKPVHGCGSLGAMKIDSYDELTNYLKSNTHSSVLIQEYLKGEEFIVDVVSYQGQHYISVLCTYKKDYIDNLPIYNYVENVSFTSSHAKEMIDYIISVLDSVGWVNGMTHNELMYTENGPRLIEVNCRQSGAHNCVNKIASFSHGRDQFDILLDSICNPDDLEKYNCLPHEKNHCRVIFLNNFTPNRIYKRFNVEKIEHLPSYKEHDFFIKPGSELPVASSLAEVVGNLLLLNEDKQQLEKDYETIYKMMLNDGLF